MNRLLQAGDKIDNYRVEQCLGVGGMGEVYLATHQILNVQRALKIPYPELLEQDPLLCERLTREGHIAAHFQHPNSIEVVNVETKSDSGFLYLVMEYVDGRTLREYLNEGVMDEKQTMLICREIACALDAAWREMHLVHRDIKPANIMIASDGTVKLADLGVAKALPGANETAKNLTMEGTLIGTPDYASPEQLVDASKVDTRADIYSIGATMYTMLTGVRPFCGATTLETMTKVLHEPLKPVREWNPGVAPEVAALVERMMSKDPADRPQTMQELVEIFDHMLEDQDFVSAPEVPETPPPIEGGATVLLAAPSDKEVKPARNNNSRLIEIICIVLFLTVIALAHLYLTDKYVYAKKERQVFIAEANRLKNASPRHWYPGSSKTSDRRYTYGVHYNYNGTRVNETADFSGIHILESAKVFSPNAFRNCKSLTRISLPADILESFVARIHEFPQLRTITVYCYSDTPMPDVTLPPDVRLIKKTMYRRRKHVVVKKPEVKPSEPVKTVAEKKPVETVKPPVAEKKKESANGTALLKILLSVPEKPSEKPSEKPVAKAVKQVITAQPDSSAYSEAKNAGLEFSPDGRILQRATYQYIRNCRIPEGVEIIAGRAFENCRSLESVVMPSTLKEIRNCAFSNCLNLRSVHLPEGLKKIEYGAFLFCKKLAQIKLPESLEFLGESFRTTSVKELNLSKSVRNISSQIAGTWMLKISPENPYLKLDRYGVLYRIEGKKARLLVARSRKLPHGHYSVIPGTIAIGNSAFADTNLSHVTLPGSVVRIGYSAFANCLKLKKVDLPAGLKTIFSGTFYKCQALTVEIPVGVNKIGNSAFYNVKKVTVAKGNRSFFTDRAGALYDKKARKLIFYPSQSILQYYTVLRGTEVIGFEAFLNCANLQGVILPEGLKKIESLAFYNCPKLQQINIPQSVEQLSRSAFEKCPKLKNVVKSSGRPIGFGVSLPRKP